MLAWLERFLALWIRAVRSAVAAVEVHVRVFLRDRFGVVHAAPPPPPVRAEDQRPRVRMTVRCSEGPPVGLVDLLERLEERAPGRIVGLREALAAAGSPGLTPGRASIVES